jgi:protein ImuA
MTQSNLNKLLSTTPQLWKGRRSNHSQRSLPTRHARLDARLPGHGWPVGAITELISCKPGMGELSLLFPALAEMGQRGQWLILVDPPWIPYPASLHGHGLPLEQLLLIRTKSEKESLWACEQALRGNRGGAMLAWPKRISFARLRRLQLAAEENGKLAFLFRPEQAAHSGSPAALRLQLHTDHQQGTSITVLKCRGSRPVDPIQITPPYSIRHAHDVLLQSHLLTGVSTAGFRERGSTLQESPLPGVSTTIN